VGCEEGSSAVGEASNAVCRSVPLPNTSLRMETVDDLLDLPSASLERIKGGLVNRERWLTLRGFVIGLLTMLLVGSAVVFTGGPALAIDCGSTINVGSRENDQEHRGVAVDQMFVWGHNNPDKSPNGATDVGCDRVSTLVVFNGFSKQMEIGWHIIPDNSSVCPIDTSTPQQPFFVIIRTSPGPIQTCEYTASPLPLSPLLTDSMKESNPNQDGHWAFSLDGGAIGTTPATDWTVGWAASNGERHTDHDSAHSKFVGLQYINASGPHPWDSYVQVSYIDSDPYYNASKISGNNDQILVSR